MSKTRTRFHFVAILLILACTLRASFAFSNPTVSPAELKAFKAKLKGCPQKIIDLAMKIQGMPVDKIDPIVAKMFGKPDRFTGSGIVTCAWDIEGGTLNHASGLVPTFNGIYLYITHNPILKTILSSFQIFAADRRGNLGWIGNIRLYRNGRYYYDITYTDPGFRQEAKKNFVVKYPKGRYTIKYSKSITKNQLLENIPDKTVICTITFTSKDQKHKITYSLINNEKERNIAFGNCGHDLDIYAYWPSSDK